MKTTHDGANAERRAFRAYIKRKRRFTPYHVFWMLDDILMWIDKRTARYNKRKGGL